MIRMKRSFHSIFHYSLIDFSLLISPPLCPLEVPSGVTTSTLKPTGLNYQMAGGRVRHGRSRLPKLLHAHTVKTKVQ